MGDTTTVPDLAEEFADEADPLADLDELLWDPIATAAVSRSHPQFDERVLDACSRGGASALPTAELVWHGGTVDAVDPDERLVDRARERAGERMPQLRLHVADIAEWETEGYDLVQCVLGVHTFADVEADTRRLIERARPGGRVAITLWARGALEPLPELLAAAAPSDDDGDRVAVVSPTIAPADTAGTLAHWLTELGLVDVRAESVQRHLDLTPDLAWSLVLGTGLGTAVADLDDAELDGVRRAFLTALAERNVRSVDATTLIAVGRRPE